MRTNHPSFATRLLTILVLGLVVAGCGLRESPLQRGERLLDGGDFQGAVRAYSEAIEQGQHPALAYANRCYANQKLGRNEDAVRDCNRALELDPDIEGVHEVLNNRGVALVGLRRYEEALTDFDAALERREDYAEALANRGVAYAQLDRFSEAIKDLDRATELDSSLAEAYGNLAYAYESMGDIDNAMLNYEEAIQRREDPQAYFSRAVIWYNNGCHLQAHADYERAAELTDDSQFLHSMAVERRDFLEDLIDNWPEDKDIANECSLNEDGTRKDLNPPGSTPPPAATETSDGSTSDA